MFFKKTECKRCGIKQISKDNQSYAAMKAVYERRIKELQEEITFLGVENTTLRLMIEKLKSESGKSDKNGDD